MSRRMRRAVALSLLALGALGMLATGSGGWPGASWPWLLVLALGVVVHVAGDHYSQRLRLERRTASALRSMEETARNDRREAMERLKALAERIDAVGTPEGMKALVDNVNRMAKDLERAKEVTDRITNAGGLTALLKGMR